ncbi:MAG: UDP-N-acetylmuramoyl-L-alanyl-D-glutamate--2,6-diaminopimelate ligase [Azospirillaceae bacterium]
MLTMTKDTAHFTRLPGIAGLTADSRRVRPGYLFAAIPGTRTDGRHFIADAIAAGAIAVLAPTGTRLPEQVDADGVTLLTDDNVRRRFALACAAFHGRQPAHIAAVTGTNGKTSTAQFCRQLWVHAGLAGASMGTLGITAPGRVTYGALTTPDPASLHETLAALADAGVSHLVIEASSHGLDQYRLDGVAVGAAGFTNLTRDHLDYHGTMEAYEAAKLRLFTELLPANGIAVVNVDSEAGRRIAEAVRSSGRALLDYGRSAQRLRLVEQAPGAQGQRLVFVLDGVRHAAEVPVVGSFQATNILCALGLAMASGLAAKAAIAGLPYLTGVRGRLERVAVRANGAAVYVDYAHTPDALETVLKAVRPHVAGRLAVVFGCGGDRDPGKRPLMGLAAVANADIAVLTDDNPRTEDPAAIRAQVLAAVPEVIEIGDRAAAIREAVSLLETGDVLVVAGKGHETGQIVGTTIRPFDDAEQARQAVAMLDGDRGEA